MDESIIAYCIQRTVLQTIVIYIDLVLSSHPTLLDSLLELLCKFLKIILSKTAPIHLLKLLIFVSISMTHIS